MLAILEQPEMRRHAVPVSVAAYERMTELGLVDEKTELVRGVIFEKMSKSPLHSGLIHFLIELLQPHLPAGCSIRTEQPLRLSDSCPEPDIAVVEGSARQFLQQHPATARLVIEIAVSSEAIDREKAAIYAEAGVEEYWIVLPDRGNIECFTQPADGAYHHHAVIPAGNAACSAGLPGFAVNLNTILNGG
jgi:Uma2 family endonuclease